MTLQHIYVGLKFGWREYNDLKGEVMQIYKEDGVLKVLIEWTDINAIWTTVWSYNGLLTENGLIKEQPIVDMSPLNVEIIIKE